MERLNRNRGTAACCRRKYFSTREANKALVLVKRIVADAVEEYARLLEQQELVELAAAQGSSEYSERVKRDMGRMVHRLQEYIAELEQVGVELRDFERGQVDFPAVRDGREIRLCWELGQPRVSFWYEPDTGFAARRPIAELTPKRQAAVRQV